MTLRDYAIFSVNSWTEEEKRSLEGVDGHLSLDGIVFQRRYAEGEELQDPENGHIFPVPEVLEDSEVSTSYEESEISKPEPSWRPWSWITSLLG